MNKKCIAFLCLTLVSHSALHACKQKQVRLLYLTLHLKYDTHFPTELYEKIISLLLNSKELFGPEGMKASVGLNNLTTILTSKRHQHHLISFDQAIGTLNHEAEEVLKSRRLQLSLTIPKISELLLAALDKDNFEPLLEFCYFEKLLEEVFVAVKETIVEEIRKTNQLLPKDLHKLHIIILWGLNLDKHIKRFKNTIQACPIEAKLYQLLLQENGKI